MMTTGALPAMGVASQVQTKLFIHTLVKVKHQRINVKEIKSRHYAHNVKYNTWIIFSID